MVAMGSASMIHFPLYCFESESELEFVSFSLSSANNVCFNQHHQCCARWFFWTHITFYYPFSTSSYPYLHMSWDGFLGVRSPCLVPCYTSLGHLFQYFIALGLQTQTLAILFLNFDSILIRGSEWGDVQQIYIHLDVLLYTTMVLLNQCHLESLIPNIECKVWKLLVYFGIIWSLLCCKVFHLMYWSSYLSIG